MKPQSHRLLAVLLIVAMLATAVTPVFAAPSSQAGGEGDLQLTAATAVAVPSKGIVVEPKGATGPATYLVQLKDAGLATYRGGIAGLAATSLAATGERKLDANSDSAKAYLDYLAGQRAVAIAAADAALGRPLNVAFEYMASFNGFAAEMSPAEAAKIAALPGVVRVEREQMFELDTDAGPAWIGAPGIWDGSATGGLPGTQGEGIIVGVIDTGIDPWNPSFAATGDDGYTVENPYGDGVYVGVCDPANTAPPAGTVAYDPTFPCNSKLIGVWGYTASDPNPRDADGHGSHTASTAAGNVIYDSTVEPPSQTFTAPVISGVAPHANIIMYDGCIDGGGCPGASLSAARDQAILDGVDVINYSIGSGSPTGDPYNDIEALQWLAIREAGIFAATSAGNAGPGAATAGSPGDLPWIITVGATTHDRAFLNSLSMDDGTNPAITLDGEGMTSGYGPAEVVLSSDYVIPPATATDARLCAPGAFPPGTFNGEIVVCERGVHGRVAKGQSVADGGAGGYVLAQPSAIGGGPGALSADPHVIPGLHITYDSYQALLAYLDAAPGPVMGAISGATLDYSDAHGDITAAFSSRGPNRGTFTSVIVPSVTAPGLNIWAAYRQGAGGDGDYTWNVISGTSMASPHTAGAGALMKALYPDWSPAQIQSALMTTANNAVLDDDGVTTAGPFAQGSGRIDLGMAAQAGLVLDVTIDEYVNSDPAAGGDPRALNLASLGNSSCVLECSWTRTFESTLDADESWDLMLHLPDGVTGSVTPSSFTVPAGGSQDVTVTVNVGGVDADQWYFGELMLTPVSAGVPEAHLPIAVQPTTGDIPELVSIMTQRDAGSQLVAGLTSVPTNDLTVEAFGLAKASTFDIALDEDPTNGSAYDDLSQVWWATLDVPAGASRLVAEITRSTAPDVDLFWGSGSTPSAATQLGVSAGGSWNEYLNAHNPPAGTYWVLVQNWQGSANQPDDIGLAVAAVGGDAGNMWVDAPTSVGALEPFDVTVYYDLDAMAGDFWYGSFTLGTDAANPGNIGSVDVNLRRVQDDVSKTASVAEAMPGDVVDYTIEIQPNISDVDLNYVLTDTIPAGMTYVDGSATASSGTVGVSGNVLTWSGVLAVPGATYEVSTSADNPMCDTGFGGYVNLQDFGILAQSGITGDTTAWTTFSSGDPINYYGNDYAGMSFTDDGFAIFDVANNYAGEPWVAQAVPDLDAPNNVLAINWQDFEIFYDQALNHGVSVATAGAPGGVVIVEYDDIQFYGGSADTFDFQVVMQRAVDNTPGAYEIVYAYDNLNGSLAGPLTVGVENAAGDNAAALVNNASAEGVLSDGFMVCFDLVASGQDPVVITYQAMVDTNAPEGDLTNNVESITDNPGSMVESTSATVTVLPGAFEGSVMQTASTSPVVPGTFIDVDVSASNSNGDLADALFLAPIDPDTMYVDGSAYGGAMPLTAAEALAKGLTDLAAGRAPEDVVAVAWAGPFMNGDMVDFGFTVQVMASSGEVQHDVALFDGATFVTSFVGEALAIVDNSTYPVSRARRFNVDRDTFINGAQPGTHYGDSQTMWTGFFGQQRPLVHTPLNGIPGDAYVDVAYLYLYIIEGRGFTTWANSVIDVEVHPVTAEWMPVAANWWMPWAMAGGDYGPAVGANHIGSGKIGTWLRLDVTDAVTDMLRGAANQGYIITNDDSTGVRYALAAKEYFDASKVGYIRVYFRTAN